MDEALVSAGRHSVLKQINSFNIINKAHMGLPVHVMPHENEQQKYVQLK